MREKGGGVNMSEYRTTKDVVHELAKCYSKLGHLLDEYFRMIKLEGGKKKDGK